MLEKLNKLITKKLFYVIVGLTVLGNVIYDVLWMVDYFDVVDAVSIILEDGVQTACFIGLAILIGKDKNSQFSKLFYILIGYLFVNYGYSLCYDLVASVVYAASGEATVLEASEYIVYALGLNLTVIGLILFLIYKLGNKKRVNLLKSCEIIMILAALFYVVDLVLMTILEPNFDYYYFGYVTRIFKPLIALCAISFVSQRDDDFEIKE